MSEVDKYRSNPWGMSATGSNGAGYGGYVAFTPKILADAAIAELEAENERLRSFPAVALGCSALQAHTERAEAALAQLRTRCLYVCGWCEHNQGHFCREMGEDHPKRGRCFVHQPCHFDPSRWSERNTP